MITLQHYLILSIILFSIGAVGAVARRNIVIVIMSISLMYISAILSLVAFARWNLLPFGRGIAVIMMLLAISMVIIGLSIAAAANAKTKCIYSDRFNLLKG